MTKKTATVLVAFKDKVKKVFQ